MPNFDVFISHSSKNKEIARLTAHGLPTQYKVQLLANNEVYSRIAIADSASGEVIRHAVPFSFSTELEAEL